MRHLFVRETWRQVQLNTLSFETAEKTARRKEADMAAEIVWWLGTSIPKS